MLTLLILRSGSDSRLDCGLSGLSLLGYTVFKVTTDTWVFVSQWVLRFSTKTSTGPITSRDNGMLSWGNGKFWVKKNVDYESTRLLKLNTTHNALLLFYATLLAQAIPRKVLRHLLSYRAQRAVSLGHRAHRAWSLDFRRVVFCGSYLGVTLVGLILRPSASTLL